VYVQGALCNFSSCVPLFDGGEPCICCLHTRLAGNDDAVYCHCKVFISCRVVPKKIPAQSAKQSTSWILPYLFLAQSFHCLAAAAVFISGD